MNVYNHKRGTICVARAVGPDGRIEWLALDNQRFYQEWNGCFSVI